MKRYLTWISAMMFMTGCLLVMPVHLLAQQGSDQVKTIQKSITVLRDMAGGKGIPPEVLQNAKGIAIVPGLTKVALGIGGSHGSGVAVENVNGQWSPPVFINISGGSLGAQIGVSETDVVLVFQDRNSFQKMLNGNFKLGADASVAAGSSARGYTANEKSADVLTYKKSEGAFVGASLSGSSLNIDQGANKNFYNQSVSPQQIIEARNVNVPPAAKELDQAVRNVVHPGR